MASMPSALEIKKPTWFQFDDVRTDSASGLNPKLFRFSADKRTVRAIEKAHVTLTPTLSKGRHELYFVANQTEDHFGLQVEVYGRLGHLVGFSSKSALIVGGDLVKDESGVTKRHSFGHWKHGDAIKLVVDLGNSQVSIKSPYGELTVDCNTASVPLYIGFNFVSAGVSLTIITKQQFEASATEPIKMALLREEETSAKAAKMIRRKDTLLEDLRVSKQRATEDLMMEIEQLKAEIRTRDERIAALTLPIFLPDFKFGKLCSESPDGFDDCPSFEDSDGSKTRQHKGSRWIHGVSPAICKSCGPRVLRFRLKAKASDECFLGVGVCEDIEETDESGYIFNDNGSAFFGDKWRFCDEQPWGGWQVGDELEVTADLGEGTFELKAPNGEYSITIDTPVPSKMSFYFSLGGDITLTIL